MCRAAVLAIVLTLASGPSATLLCSVWCHPDEARPSSCRHGGATAIPRVTAEDSCPIAPASATPAVREAVTRGPEAAGAPHAILQEFQGAWHQAHAQHAHDLTAPIGAKMPPVLIPLRI